MEINVRIIVIIKLAVNFSAQRSKIKVSYGDRTFAAAGPRLWNSLPVQLRNPDITYSYGLFRRQLN